MPIHPTYPGDGGRQRAAASRTVRAQDSCAASLAAEVGLPKARTALETLAVAGRYARDVIAAALVALLEEQNR